VLLIDGRAAERYRGEIEPVDPVAGHIPTAVNLPVTGNLAADSKLLSAANLRDRYAALTADREVVVSCGSGTNACHTALAQRLAGLPDPTLYAGSFSDWARSGLPVATGSEPGETPR
jgi:thiosulfate/3-mercaptopyruvate sulfurtransferase